MPRDTITKPPVPASPSPVVLGTLTADITRRVDHALRVLVKDGFSSDTMVNVAAVTGAVADLQIAALSCEAMLLECAKEVRRAQTIARQQSLIQQAQALVEYLLGAGAIDAEHMPDTYPKACALLVLLSAEEA